MIEQEKLNNLNNREKKLEREEKMCGAEEVLKKIMSNKPQMALQIKFFNKKMVE